MHIHWLRLFVVFQEIQCLLNFHYDVFRQGIEIYPCIKFCLSQCFPLSVASTYICLYWPRFFVWFSKKYSVYIILTVTMFVTSQSFISLPCFMFVSAAVSEIHDLNQNKKEKKFENGNFQITTFPRHISGLMRVTF